MVGGTQYIIINQYTKDNKVLITVYVSVQCKLVQFSRLNLKVNFFVKETILYHVFLVFKFSSSKSLGMTKVIMSHFSMLNF